MTKPKTLDQLRAEKERAETQLAQEQHKLERLENRKKYLEKDVFHQLCHFGACEIFDLRGKALNRAAQIAKPMALFHLSVTQTKRSAGQSAFASAREKMYSISSVISVRVRSLTSGARLSIVPSRLQRRSTSSKIGRAHV